MNFEIKISQKYLKHWAVYTLSDNGMIVYCGINTLGKVQNIPELIGNPLFDRNKEYTLRVIRLCENKTDAYNFSCAYVRQFRDILPLNLVRAYGKQSLVICVQTGQVWRSVSACASAISAQPSRLSNHLNEKSGHKSIFGKTYKRVYLADIGGIEALQSGYATSDAWRNAPNIFGSI